jgi:hypothetical protein
LRESRAGAAPPLLLQALVMLRGIS